MIDAGPEAIAALSEMLDGADRVLVFTGAGISTASGIPDYRGPQGVWKTRTPVYYQDFMRSEAARIEYWQQKLEDHEQFSAAPPNPVHHAVAKLEAIGKIEMVVTQNIDGLHRAAGTSEEKLVEIHGTVAEVECQTCGARTDPDPHFLAFQETGLAPTCSCGGYLKSATISFGQNLRGNDMTRAMIAADNADMVLALGSTLSVYPAADIPLRATAKGAPYVIVNRGDTDHDRHAGLTLRIDGDVGAVIPAAVDALASSMED